ncbi:MAG: GvpL/GvpF family gas vesicle protein [Methylococcaceae bacterium]|nr:GvpL/GvpF family gas vesicle protein [Methylococcaceae bacterium]
MESSPQQAGEAVYLYCFSLPDLSMPLGPGVDEDKPITVHRHGGLAAVLGWVALEDYTGEAGEAHLQDIAWLGPRACRHAVVVEQAMAKGPVYPIPFGTLFSNLTVLEREIEDRSAEITSVLLRVADCQEWCVEGSLDRKRALEHLLAESLRSGRFHLPDNVGRRHLEEQKLRRELALELDDWVRQHLQDLQEHLMSLTRDCRPRRLLGDRIAHWAFLVPVERVESFRGKVDEIASRQEAYGLNFRLTGPWPPYSFCQATP